jgi:hypothetical protein
MALQKDIFVLFVIELVPCSFMPLKNGLTAIILDSWPFVLYMTMGIQIESPDPSGLSPKDFFLYFHMFG